MTVGSTNLTPEQTAWYEKHFGLRYTTISEQPFRPSRRLRRGRPKDATDVGAYEAQQRVREAVERAPLKAQVK